MVWEETIVTSRDSALDIMVTRKSVFWKYIKCFLVKNVCEIFIDCVVVLFDVLVLYIGVMSGGRSIDKERKSPRESGEDSEDESEILEESPCGRWLKRREEVSSTTLSLNTSFTWIYLGHLRQRPASADSQGYRMLYK